MKRWVGVALGAVCLAAMVSGCGSTQGLGLPWIPQGPGGSTDEARARASSTAAARPAAATSASAAAPVPATAPVGPSAPAATTAPTAQVAQGTPAAPAAPAAPSASPAPGANPANPGSGYTQATRYGDLLFISGQIAMDPRTRDVSTDASIEEQARMTMDNLRSVLEANGLTMANLLATTVYLKNINDLPKLDAVYARAFKGTLPSRTVVEVSRLPRGVLLEISAVAGR